MGIILIVYAIIGAIVLRRLELYPSVVNSTDALAYVSLGHSFPSLEPLRDLRTYGFPALTWIYSHLGGGLDPRACALVGGAIQFAAYGAAVFWLASQFQGKASVAIAAGLLLNPILVAIAGDMLTEGPTLIIAVLMVAFLVKIERGQAVAWSAVGALLTNFALMVRPSNIVLIVAWNAAVMVALRWRQLAIYAGAFAITAIVAWTPQVIHNLSLGHLSVLPVRPLLERQISWGTSIARYSSMVSSDRVAFGYALLNPWRTGDLDATAFWYFEHPVAGIATLAVHVLGAFTFDRVFTYLYDCRPIYWLAGAMWGVVALGAIQGARLLRRNSKRPAAIAVVLMFVLTIALIAIVTPENRFATVPLAILSPLAAHLALTFEGKPRWFFAVAIVVPILGWQFAHALNAYQPSESYVKFGCPK